MKDIQISNRDFNNLFGDHAFNVEVDAFQISKQYLVGE